MADGWYLMGGAILNGAQIPLIFSPPSRSTAKLASVILTVCVKAHIIFKRWLGDALTEYAEGRLRRVPDIALQRLWTRRDQPDRLLAWSLIDNALEEVGELHPLSVLSIADLRKGFSQ